MSNKEKGSVYVLTTDTEPVAGFMICEENTEEQNYDLLLDGDGTLASIFMAEGIVISRIAKDKDTTIVLNPADEIKFPDNFYTENE